MAGYIGNKAVGLNVTTGNILGDVGVGGDVTVGDDLAVTGSATIANGLTLTDGNLTVASGHGINFAATGNISGTSSELLDDYEEGSFNLLMVGSNGAPNATQNLGSQYVKVGKLVSFRSFGTLNNTGAAGQISFSGLPFAPTGVCIVNIECNKQGTFSLSPYGYISGTVIYIQQMRSETTYVAINHNTATSGEWSITGCFHTNS